MISVKGIYDGKNIQALEKLPTDKKYKVVITFLEEISEDEGLRIFSANTNSFKFWESSEEDLYQEYPTWTSPRNKCGTGHRSMFGIGRTKQGIVK